MTAVTGTSNRLEGADGGSLLRLEGLSTSFFLKHGVVRAVNNVSLQIPPGETVGLVGESGCGKSVTGLSVLRLVPPPGRITGGRVVLQGENLLEMDGQRMRKVRGDRISMIFQDPMTSLNPVLTIERQLTESITAHTGCTRREARNQGIELMRMVGIPSPADRIDDYPHQFSGGMRQRVMIAAALSCSPSLLIADEPTTALDVTIQAQIMDLMKRICNETGTSILLITHDLGIVAGVCRTVAIMYAGRIVELAESGEMFRNSRHPYTHGLLGSTPRMDRPARKLNPIGGLPPSLVDPPEECAFAPRCAYTVDQCRRGVPPLEQAGGGHLAACWRSGEDLW